MTFDDGIVRLYTITDQAQPGKKPIKGLTLRESFYFGFETLGINRYYTALQAGDQIESVISIPGWQAISAAQTVAIMEDGLEYKVVLAQPTLDEDGLRITRLSLERLGDEYVVLP